MTLLRDNLTSKQKDWSIFLPALSSFYALYVGKQRHGEYIEKSRIPTDFETGIEGLNWLNADEAYFPYKWALYSAGHAELDINKISPKEDMIRNRDRQHSFVLGDSGGFQIGKGAWEGNWKDINCPKASLKRTQVLSWMDEYMDYGMILDIPAWIRKDPVVSKSVGIHTFEDAVKGTEINNNFFMRNRNGNCKFLNVLQGDTHLEADTWYKKMKHYCDPKQHEQPFEGWAMGGQNMCDVHLVLRRLVALRFDGLLEKGRHDWMHFLGTSKLEWAVLLTDIQRAVRKYHNEDFTVSFDCASPFLATANGQIYYQTDCPDRGKWSYRMSVGVDDKKYAIDNRLFGDALRQDKILPLFEDSPVSLRTKISDICVYKAGDLNKIGKEGKTSWDSFSYAIQMGHNVWTHIHAVQEANRQRDAGNYPSMLVASKVSKKKFRQYDRNFFADIIDDIFSTSDRGKAEKLIEHYWSYWLDIPGTRGYTGAKTVNSHTQFSNLFTEDGETIEEHHIDDSGLDEHALDELESLTA